MSWDALFWEIARHVAVTETVAAAPANPAECENPGRETGTWEKTKEERWYEGQDVMQRLHYERTVTDRCTGEESTQRKTEGPFRLWEAVPANRVSDVNRPVGSDQPLSGAPLGSSELAQGTPSTGPEGQPVASGSTVPGRTSPDAKGRTPFMLSLAILMGVLMAAVKQRRPRWGKYADPEPESADGGPGFESAAGGAANRDGRLTDDNPRFFVGGLWAGRWDGTPMTSELHAGERAGGSSQTLLSAADQEQRVRAVGFSDLAVRLHGSDTLTEIMDAHVRLGTSPRDMAKVVKRMNEWAESVASGEAARTDQFVNSGMSIGLGMVPAVGEVKDAQEAITGVDYITGDKLQPWERWVTVGAFFLPFVGGGVVRKALQKGGDIVADRTVREAVEHAVEGITKRSGREATERGAKGILKHSPELSDGVVHSARHAGDVVDAAGTAGRFSPDFLRSLPSFGSELAMHLPENMTLTRFNQLRVKAMDDLSAEEAAMLLLVRGKVPAPTQGTIMQRTVTEEAAAMYRNGGKFSSTVKGFVGRAQDAAELRTSKQVIEGNQLLYEGTEFKENKSVFAIRFKLQDPAAVKPAIGATTKAGVQKVATQHGLDKDRLVRQLPPYTGNGFTASKTHVIPEYMIDEPIPLHNGDEMWEITPEGIQRLNAVYNEDARRMLDVER